jgi:hypothetical protein
VKTIDLKKGQIIESGMSSPLTVTKKTRKGDMVFTVRLYLGETLRYKMSTLLAG